MNTLPASDKKECEIMTPATQPTQKKGPCCACPETKKARDECILMKSEEECFDYIQAHKECMRKEGYNIQ
jgi:cytochrome c oxidase assembly protein subunit 17